MEVYKPYCLICSAVFLGLGGVVLRRQAKDYVTKALAEFQRLELRHKEQEAREILKQLT